jgi:hypothetical protein
MCCFSYACVSRLINIHNHLTIVENVDVDVDVKKLFSIMGTLNILILEKG